MEIKWHFSLLNEFCGAIAITRFKTTFSVATYIHKNKMFMRGFRDFEMVKQLGSGVPRTLQNYSKESYVFLNNFTRIVMPYAEGFTESLPKTNLITGQATPQLNKFDELLE